MLNLFKAEVLRYRFWVIALSLGHFLLLSYVQSTMIGDPLSEISKPWSGAMILVAILFGVVQMRAYKRTDAWIHLLHRPLSEKRIFLSLAAAAAVILFSFVLLPALVTLAYTDLADAGWVELKHYLLLWFVAAGMACGYCCACFAALYPSKLSVLCLILVSVFFDVRPESRLFWPSLAAMAWSFYLAYQSFRADRTQSFKRIGPMMAAAIPIQYMALWALVMLGLIVFAGLTRVNYSDRSEDGLANLNSQLNDKERIGDALEAASADGAAIWQQAESQPPTPITRMMSYANPRYINRQIVAAQDNDPRAKQALERTPKLNLPTAILDMKTHPRRHDLALKNSGRIFREPLVWDKTIWRFSHKEMLYQGRDRDNSSLAGWFGPQGFYLADSRDIASEQRFQEVPWAWWDPAWQHPLIVGKDKVWIADLSQQSITQVFDFAGGQGFYLINPESIFSDGKPATPIKIDWPAGGNNAQIANASIARLDNGYFLSVLSDYPQPRLMHDYDEHLDLRILLFRIDEQGTSRLIAAPKLDPVYGGLYIFKDFMLSPGLRWLSDQIWDYRNKHRDSFTLIPEHYRFIPGWVLLGAALLSLASALLTWLMLRSHAMPRRIKIFWTALNTFSGVAGLLGFWLLHRRANE